MLAKINKIARLAILCGGIALSYTPAFADGSFMNISKRTSQPIGHLQFCSANKRECAHKTSQAKIVHLSRKRWQELLDVNNLINQRIQPATDLETYHQEEFWTYPAQYGDCEDYVLLKQRELAALGWPVSSLLITVVRRPDGDGHAVLTVRTDKGDYILDNIDGTIRPWNETVYQYIKRQSAHDSGKWKKIEDTRFQLAAIKS